MRVFNNMENEKKIAIATLGCRLNQFESDGLMSQFVAHGYSVVSCKELADIYIVNTCSVTNQSDVKSRNLISALKRKAPNSKIYVTGCYASTDADVLNKMEATHRVVGNDKKYALFHLIHSEEEGNIIPLDSIRINRFYYRATKGGLRTRGYLKIQDGCDEGCSYCKIPQARGSGSSRPYADAIKNAKLLIENGYKEIVITGVNIGDYFSENKNLTDLISNLLDLSSNTRIRISSIEPNKVSNDFLKLFLRPNLCQHLHLPLQSGNQRILSLMKRRYTPKDYVNVVQHARVINPNINITTDLMVGFPTESEEEFQDSLKLIQQLQISHVHTFKYSHRRGTKSENMSDVKGDIKTERGKLIRDLSEEQNYAYRKRFFSCVLHVLKERNLGNGISVGYSDNYIRIQYEGINDVIGSIFPVKVTQVLPDKTVGQQMT